MCGMQESTPESSKDEMTIDKLEHTSESQVDTSRDEVISESQNVSNTENGAMQAKLNDAATTSVRNELLEYLDAIEDIVGDESVVVNNDKRSFGRFQNFKYLLNQARHSKNGIVKRSIGRFLNANDKNTDDQKSIGLFLNAKGTDNTASIDKKHIGRFFSMRQPIDTLNPKTSGKEDEYQRQRRKEYMHSTGIYDKRNIGRFLNNKYKLNNAFPDNKRSIGRFMNAKYHISDIDSDDKRSIGRFLNAKYGAASTDSDDKRNIGRFMNAKYHMSNAEPDDKRNIGRFLNAKYQTTNAHSDDKRNIGRFMNAKYHMLKAERDDKRSIGRFMNAKYHSLNTNSEDKRSIGRFLNAKYHTQPDDKRGTETSLTTKPDLTEAGDEALQARDESSSKTVNDKRNIGRFLNAKQRIPTADIHKRSIGRFLNAKYRHYARAKNSYYPYDGYWVALNEYV